MRRLIFGFVAFLSMVTPLLAGSGVTRQTYVDNRGNYLGRSYTNQSGQTRYYNYWGQPSGFSQQYGPTTRYYGGRSNIYLGDILTRPNGIQVIRPYNTIR